MTRYLLRLTLFCTLALSGCTAYLTPDGAYEYHVTIRIDPPRYAEPTPTQETTFPTPQPYRQGRVTTNELNIRSAPGVNNPIVGKLLIGNVVRIIGENEAKTWYQVEDEQGITLGWVSAQYVEEYRG